MGPSRAPLLRFVRRLGRKVARGVRRVVDEAAHPGYPPPHRASDNPFFVQPEERARASHQEGNLRREGDVPWYLEGSEDVEGWDSTDARPDDPKE